MQVSVIFRHTNSGDNMSGQTSDYKNINFSGILSHDVSFIEEIFKKDSVLRIKRIEQDGEKPLKCALIYMDGMVDSLQLNEAVIKPLLVMPQKAEPTTSAEYIATHYLFARDTKITLDFGSAIEGLLYGEAILLIDGITEAINIDAKGWRTRGIAEPENEKILQGPREGFEEAALLNLAMIRRKLQTPDLCIESMRLGRRSGTLVFLCYLDSLAKPQLIETLKKRLKKIDIDGVLDSNYIVEELNEGRFKLFKTTGSTERPDTVAARLLEGRIAIVVDGTPVVITVPYLFSENFQSDEDYYLNFAVSTTGRILRYICFLLAVAVPALYIALITFHKDLLPTNLAIVISELRGGVPFSPLGECLILIVAFEILREAGIRMPQSLGYTLSIVGGIVVGQAAVDARIISTPMLIVIALSGIAGLVIPRLKGAIFYLRLIFVVLSSLFGLLGLLSGLFITVMHIISLSSFGTDYTVSLRRANYQSLKDTLFRAPWTKMKTRPDFNRNITRQKGKNR